MHHDAGGGQFTHHVEYGQDIRAAQESFPQGRVRGVDRNIKGREPLGDDPVQVFAADIGKGYVVAVEEGEAVVLILYVQRSPKPLGKLVDEAEDTFVPTLGRCGWSKDEAQGFVAVTLDLGLPFLT
jgi:hypothetical protein